MSGLGHGYRLPDPKWQGEIRSCCRCGIKDSPLFTGDRDGDGAPIFEHRVTLDLTFIDRKAITPKEKSLGFLFMAVGDRNAKARVACRDCIQLYDDEERVWSDFNKQKERDGEEGQLDDNYYLHICE